MLGLHVKFKFSTDFSLTQICWCRTEEEKNTDDDDNDDDVGNGWDGMGWDSVVD